MINLNIKLESPELMAALLALAEVLQQKQLNSDLHTKEGQVIESKKEAVEKVTIEQVKEKLITLSRAGKGAQAKNLLKKFNAAKLSELSAKNYVAFLREADTIQ